MDVWLAVLAFVLFLGFFTAVMVCIQAIKKKPQIIIKSRIHHTLAKNEVIYANLGLVGVAVFTYFHVYEFIPALLMLVLFIMLSSKIESGITSEGVIVGTAFIEWEFMLGYKLVNREDKDSNTIILKIRANHKQYVLICERSDRENIKALMQKNGVKKIVTINNQ